MYRKSTLRKFLQCTFPYFPFKPNRFFYQRESWIIQELAVNKVVLVRKFLLLEFDLDWDDSYQMFLRSKIEFLLSNIDYIFKEILPIVKKLPLSKDKTEFNDAGKSAAAPLQSSLFLYFSHRCRLDIYKLYDWSFINDRIYVF